MNDLHPLARDFILFCIRRCSEQWPALYDEMCWVAGHHLFQNMGYTELNNIGLSLGLDNLGNVAGMVDSLTPGCMGSLQPGSAHIAA